MKENRISVIGRLARTISPNVKMENLRNVFLVLVIMGLASSTFAQDGPIGEQIAEIRASILDTMLAGEGIADRQINNAANKALILAREIEIAFANQLDKTLGQVDKNVFESMQELKTLRQSLQEGGEDLVRALDETILDLERIVGNTIFAKSEFLLKGIHGYDQLFSNDTPYHLAITGSGFGGQQVRLEKVELVDPNSSIDITKDTTINPVRQHFITLDIPNEILNDRFDNAANVASRTINTQKIRLTFVRTKKVRTWIFFSKKEETVLDHEIFMYLIPNYAGKIAFSSLEESYSWKNSGSFDYTHTTPNNHCRGDCDSDDKGDWPHSYEGPTTTDERCVTQPRNSPPRENDEYLTNATYSGNDGGHNKNERAILTKNDTCLHFRVRSRTSPVVYSVKATKMKYTKNPDPIVAEAKEQILEFGKTYQVQVKNTSRAMLYEFDPIGPAPISTGEAKAGLKNYALEVISKVKVGNFFIYNYRIPYPGEYPTP